MDEKIKEFNANGKKVNLQDINLLFEPAFPQVAGSC